MATQQIFVDCWIKIGEEILEHTKKCALKNLCIIEENVREKSLATLPS